MTVTSARDRLLPWLEVAAACGVIAFCVLGIWRDVSKDARSSASASPRPSYVPIEPVVIDGANSMGSDSAQVALIVFSDFQCPFCAVFARDVLASIVQKYVREGRVRIVFRHLPLEELHSRAMSAAQAAECAAAQHAFWPMHDVLFENQRSVGDEELLSYAAQLRLHVDQFKTCLEGERKPRIQEDVASAGALKVFGTPTVLIGRIQPDRTVAVARRLEGARLVKAAPAVIEALLRSR